MYKRRSFIKNIVIGTTAFNFIPNFSIAHEYNQKEGELEVKPLRFALIGKGGMGTADANTARRVEGVKLVAVCDLYDKRLDDAKKEWGDSIFLTKDYKEILAMKDLDAVIIATPDHWHKQIAIEALNSNKHVYCEKPVIHKLKEGKEIIKAQNNSNCVFHMGTQGISSFGNGMAKKLVQEGIIGKINFVEAEFTAGPGGLNRFVKPKDANERTIWWDRFIGSAASHDFDPQRFFAWRNWKDYGTGLAGDLFVHVISSLHFITGALGPEKVYTTGGLHYYKDGSRDTPDIMLGVFDYPDRNDVGAFKMSLGANMVDGVSKKWGSSDIKIIGDKGALHVGWDKVVLKTTKNIDVTNFTNFSDAIVSEVEFQKEFHFQKKSNLTNAHLEHFNIFFNSIKTKQPNIADVLFSVRASSTALLSFESFTKEKAILWDPEKLRMRS